MRVRPTLQPRHGAARMSPEIDTVIHVMFSKKQKKQKQTKKNKSVFMRGNLDCNKIVRLD